MSNSVNALMGLANIALAAVLMVAGLTWATMLVA